MLNRSGSGLLGRGSGGGFFGNHFYCLVRVGRVANDVSNEVLIEFDRCGGCCAW
jgi:hypothetical protein